MKKYTIVSLVLVLTAALLTGCGCTPSDMDTNTRPSATMLPTNIPETTVPTEERTEPATLIPTETTAESDAATQESGTMEETAETDNMSRSRMR